ncbi:MAG: CHAT domain-containing protein, partial [Bacteroidota bacterium]
MYESIWEPIEQSKLVKGKELILIRDGLLNYLPFELLVRDGIQQDYRDYHYLVKDYSFTYYPSATVLHFSRTQAAPVPNWQKSFLGFALSEFSHDHCLSSGLLLDDLEQAITEATTIANEFGPDQATVWTNAQATEDQLTSAKPHLYRYL